jgi:hypothetical protein
MSLGLFIRKGKGARGFNLKILRFTSGETSLAPLRLNPICKADIN